MANINNAETVLFINAKQGKVASAKIATRVQPGTKVSVSRKVAEYTDNAETGAIDMLVANLCEMSQAPNVFPKSLLVFMQDNGARRVIEARKHFNEFKTSMEGDALVQAVIGATIKDWQSEVQKQSIAQMVSIMCQIWNANLNVTVAQEHTSHSWQLNVPEGVELKNGDVLTFSNGVEQNIGITSYDTSYLDGEYTVRTNTYTDQSGKEHISYFVPRKGNVDALSLINGLRDENGKTVKKGLRQIVNELLPSRLNMASVEFVLEAVA